MLVGNHEANAYWEANIKNEKYILKYKENSTHNLQQIK